MKAQQMNRLLELLGHGLGFPGDAVVMSEVDVDLWKIAREHKVATILCQNIQKSELPFEFKEEARIVWQLAALREQAYLKEARRLQSMMFSKRISIQFLKGIFLSEHVYPRQGLRVYRDIDLLVSPKNLQKVHECLCEDGYQEIKTKGPLNHAPINQGDSLRATKSGHDAISLQKGDYFVELHTALLPPELGLLNHDEPLSPEDMFIHLCIHATRHHFIYGVRHVVDLILLVKKFPLDWEKIKRKIIQNKLEHLVWPTWQISWECFPDEIREPSFKNIGIFCRAYTRRVLVHFLKMPCLSIEFQGSPILFYFCGKNRLRRMMKLVTGSHEKMIYQTGEDRMLPRATWRLKRPYQLFFRHSKPVGALMKFILKR